MSTRSALADPDLDVVAKQVCGCLQEPHEKAVEIMKTFNATQHAGDFSKLMAMQGEMESEMVKITEASQECFEELEEKYPEIAADDGTREEVNVLAEKMCPNPADPMMGGRP